MKKFLIVCFLLIVLGYGADYLYYYNGDLYLPKTGEPVCFTGSDSDTLYLDTGSGLSSFELKGVDLELSKPGAFPTDGVITEEEYLRWFEQIQALGANVIRIYTIANPAFYEAFYQYNVNNPTPLYLIHGATVDDYLIHAQYSALDEDFYKPFLEECKDVVDVIHGRHKRSATNESLLPSRYSRDISPWVFGYILGVEWEGDFIVFTNESKAQAEQYEGEYLRTQNARNFEIALAAIGDQTIRYETRKYGSQRALAFTNWYATCPLEFSESVMLGNEKFGKLDVNNIYATEAFTGGMFASYHVYPYHPEYILQEQETCNTENSYLAYLTRLTEHHTIPVVISEFGVPASRGKASYEQNRSLGRDQGGINETKQGEALVSMYQDIKASGCAGGIVYSWQDEWFRYTWNTIPTVDLDSNTYWRDYQTNEQCFGLLSFDPGTDQSICYVDGDRSDWQEDDLVTEQNGLRLSMKYDLEFVYFLVEKDGFRIDTDTLYIPVDTTQKSGSTTAAAFNLRMSEPADFILQIAGTENSRLWVQERYDTTTALYGGQMKRNFNPLVDPPAADSDRFTQILLPLLEKNYYYNQGTNQQEDWVQVNCWDYYFSTSSRYCALIETYETGKLTYGNADPASDTFDSLADFCAGDGFVEIRLPWQLLNFADPSTMRIHDDYYECYGVEYLSIDSIRVGVGDGTETIQMAHFPMKRLGRTPQYHERLKESYYILQDHWTTETPSAG